MENKWFILVVVLLAAFFLFKLVDQSQIIHEFPLDENNDLSAYLGGLHHLDQYGFHNIVPNWYNGYVLFNHYPPGWFFFTLPIYRLLGNIQLSAFISHLLIYLLGLVVFLMLGKLQKLSLVKTLFFYLVFYVNPIAVGNFIKLGRLPELLSMSLFVAFFTLLLYLNKKERAIGLAGLIGLVLLYSSILLVHPAWFIIASLFIPGIFLLKDKKEKGMVILGVLLTFLLTSFWLVPYLSRSFSSLSLASYTGLSRLLAFRTFFFDNLFSYLLPIFLWFTAFFYFKSFKNDRGELRRELIFYALPLVVSILYFTRIAVFIPFMNIPFPDTYHMFFIFLGFFFFIKTPMEQYGKNLRRAVKLGLILLPLVFIISSVLFVPNFRGNSKLDKEILSLLPHLDVDDRLLIEKMPYPTYNLAFFSYGSIYYNLSTPSGSMSDEITYDVLALLREAQRSLLDGDCDNLVRNLNRLNATVTIAPNGHYCDNLAGCGMALEVETENTCLYRFSGG